MSEARPEEQKSKNLGVLTALFALVKPYRLQVLLASIALVVTAAVTLSIGQGLRILVDRGFGSDASPDALNQALLLFGGMILLMAVGSFIRFFLVSWIGERVCADLRKSVFAHVVTLHPGYFETHLSGDIQSRITTDTTLLQTVIGSSVSIALRNALMIIGGFVWLFITNPKLTAMVMLSVPVVVVPIVIFGRRVRTLSRDSQDKIGSVGSFVGEAVKNIKLVQAFNHQKLDAEAFDRHAESAFAVAVRRILQRSYLSTAVIVLVLGAVSAMLWVGGHDVLAGRITAGELTAFIFYAVMVAAAVGAISEVYGDLQRAAGATERLLELLAVENLVPDPKEPVALPSPVRGELSFDKVCFSYPSRPEYKAIDQLQLTVPAGTSLALVGSSGAGKSTMIDLILRFYDVEAGRICLDGVDIRDLCLATLRDQIAMVPQQPVLFTGTVADNIRYGCPDASDEAMRLAAKGAYAADFIERLPDGYDSYVGEGGVRLSGGQRQRIAIARAILADPKVLLLDEATSALDAESEYQVQQALEELMKGRTSIVIAHRLATVINVDRIAVLDHGRLVATGTHSELIQSSTLYARWASLQFDDMGGREKAAVTNLENAEN